MRASLYRNSTGNRFSPSPLRINGLEFPSTAVPLYPVCAPKLCQMSFHRANIREINAEIETGWTPKSFLKNLGWTHISNPTILQLICFNRAENLLPKSNVWPLVPICRTLNWKKSCAFLPKNSACKWEKDLKCSSRGVTKISDKG